MLVDADVPAAAAGRVPPLGTAFDKGVRRIYDERRMAVAQGFFQRWGVLAVFFGRFVALLRIFAGPLAGMNGMPWPPARQQ